MKNTVEHFKEVLLSLNYNALKNEMEQMMKDFKRDYSADFNTRLQKNPRFKAIMELMRSKRGV